MKQQAPPPAKMRTVHAHYGALRAEAIIIAEALREAGEPKTVEEADRISKLLLRAEELQRLGYESAAIVSATRGTKAN